MRFLIVCFPLFSTSRTFIVKHTFVSMPAQYCFHPPFFGFPLSLHTHRPCHRPGLVLVRLRSDRCLPPRPVWALVRRRSDRCRANPRAARVKLGTQRAHSDSLPLSLSLSLWLAHSAHSFHACEMPTRSSRRRIQTEARRRPCVVFFEFSGLVLLYWSISFCWLYSSPSRGPQRSCFRFTVFKAIASQSTHELHTLSIFFFRSLWSS
jgi:hypothetical protein